jgi:hypothetical protein
MAHYRGKLLVVEIDRIRIRERPCEVPVDKGAGVVKGADIPPDRFQPIRSAQSLSTRTHLFIDNFDNIWYRLP